MIGSKLIKQLFNFTLLFWLLTGCATGGYQADDLDYSLMDIQKVLREALPAEVGYVSLNGREFYTKPYKAEDVGTRPTHLVMKSVILGDRRPYSLSVEVHVVSPKAQEPEKAFASGEPYLSEDSHSKKLVRKVQSELAKRRKNKNLFDDFRAF